MTVIPSLKGYTTNSTSKPKDNSTEQKFQNIIKQTIGKTGESSFISGSKTDTIKKGGSLTTKPSGSSLGGGSNRGNNRSSQKPIVSNFQQTISNIQEANFKEKQKQQQNEKNLNRAIALKEIYARKQQQAKQNYIQRVNQKEAQELASLSRIKDANKRAQLKFYYQSENRRLKEDATNVYNYRIKREMKGISNIKQRLSDKKNLPKGVKVGESQNIQDFYGSERERDKTYNLILERAGERRKLLDSEKATLKRIGLDKAQIKEIAQSVQKVKRLDFSNKSIKDIKTTYSPSSLNVLYSKTSITPQEYRELANKVYKITPKRSVKEVFYNFNKGAEDGIKDTYKAVAGVLKGAYGYGYKSSEIANKNNKSVLGIWKKDASTITKGLIGLANSGNKTLKRGAEYFIKNPKNATKLILGTYALGVARKGTKKAKQLLRKFKQNPARAIGYFLGGQVIGGAIGKGAKGLSRLGKITKYTKNEFTFKKDFGNKKSSIVGKAELITKEKTRYIINYTLRTEKGTGKLLGNYKYYNPKTKKSFTERKQFIDKGKYYLDTKTKEKIFKDYAPVIESSAKLKTTKITATSEPQTILFKGGARASRGVNIEVTSIKNFLSANRKTQRTTTTRRTTKGTAVITDKGQKITNPSQIKTIIKKYSKKPDKLTNKELNLLSRYARANDILTYKTYRGKRIISGIDLRSRNARVLGLGNKELKQFNKILKQSQKDGNQLTTLKISGRGTFEEGKKPIYLRDILRALKPTASDFDFGKKYGKKASLGRAGQMGVQRLEVEKIKLKPKAFKGSTKLQQTIQLPKLKLSPKVVRSLGRQSRYMKAFRVLSGLIPKQRNLIRTINKTTTINQKLVRNIQLVRTQQLRINKLTKLVINKVQQITKVQPRMKPSLKMRTRIVPRSPRARFRIKPPTAIIPKIRFKLNSKQKLPKGYRLSYNAYYRSGGRVREIKLNLPYYKALQRITRAVDNTTARSLQLRAVGITKQKDITSKNLRKFRSKSPRSRKTLRIVEKSKYAIDTRGEKRGLSIARYFKKRKR